MRTDLPVKEEEGFSVTRKFIAAAAAVFSVSLISTTIYSSEVTLCKGFVPENNMKIPVGLFTAGGISEQQFNQVIDRLIKIYGPEIAAQGNRLKVNRLWTDATVNASAQRSGKDFILNMYGGLARHPAINVEGFALVICHEMGHHIGGAPKVSGWGNNWASNEGASDYFATLKCLRRFFAEDDNASILQSVDLDETALDSCTSQHPNMQDRLLCLRNSIAGQSVAELFQALRKQPTRPRYNTPDTKVVSRTDDQHPDTQCRLDTYFQGALCPTPIDEAMSDTDVRQGACYAGRDTVGLRPRCWYAPSKAGY